MLWTQRYGLALSDGDTYIALRLSPEVLWQACGLLLPLLLLAVFGWWSGRASSGPRICCAQAARRR